VLLRRTTAILLLRRAAGAARTAVLWLTLENEMSVRCRVYQSHKSQINGREKEDEHSRIRLVAAAGTAAGHIDFVVGADILDCTIGMLAPAVLIDNLHHAARTTVVDFVAELAIAVAGVEVRHPGEAAQEAGCMIVVLDLDMVYLRDKVVVVRAHRRRESQARLAGHQRQDERTCSSRCNDVESVRNDNELGS
jgi:uncharacterized membrane protein YjjP (DUF1212 family)